MWLAVLIAASPWVELSGGPVLMHQRDGMASGPTLRLDLGWEIGERAALEAWISGTMAGAPKASPGDSGFLSAGGGARLLLAKLDSRIGLWAHGGAGWYIDEAIGGRSGPSGFGGAMLSFQPFLQRFQVGIEADALYWAKAFGQSSAIGFGVMPSLRCSW